jgi:anti-anti-sigma regulatory factor
MKASILDDAVVAAHPRAALSPGGPRGRRLFVLNFSQVKSLASRMLGQLVALHKRLQEVGGRVVLCEATPFLYEFFETANLPGFLCIREGEADAIRP